MLKKDVEDALNLQLNRETFSAYLYFSMAAWLNSQDLPGFSQWMVAQGMEELTHAQKFYAYIQQRGGTVRLEAVAGPKVGWESTLELFEETLAHEVFVTGSINSLVDIARDASDHAAGIFLQWFVTEQVEEEESVGQVLQRLRRVGDNPSALIMMDGELGKRMATASSATPAE
ncbi:ferritin [Desulfoluna sp.]|uniref:ferritin n=1 Tax=Desulfoluna sp. TaxID=2045199 RepID=UPI0026046263|nr:ferritin [Desulfoluna sp.]